MKTQDMLVLPGAYDCITARLIERAGFPAAYMTGAGTAAICGYPDYGLATMSETVQNAGPIPPSLQQPPGEMYDAPYERSRLSHPRHLRPRIRAAIFP